MFNYSKQSLQKLEGVHPDLVKVMKLAITNSPYDFKITQGVRTGAEQYALYCQGRTILKDKKGNKLGKVTDCDGITKKSNHQAKADGFGYAIDIAILNPNNPKEIIWSDIAMYTKVANHIKAIAKEQNIKLEWGGDWKSFKDYPHIELFGIIK